MSSPSILSQVGIAPKDFFELVKAIGESKSKQEEDRIVSDEVSKYASSPFMTN